VRHAVPQPRGVVPLMRRRERLAEARVGLALEVGRTALSRHDLAGLAVDDVVGVEHICVRDASRGPGTLRLRPRRFEARLDGERLTLRALFRLHPGALQGAPGGTTMTDNDSEKTDAAATDHLLRELPVEVTCELGRVTMTGRELLELRPGAVIPVGR